MRTQCAAVLSSVHLHKVRFAKAKSSSTPKIVSCKARPPAAGTSGSLWHNVSSMDPQPVATLRRTGLNQEHHRLRARMVPFAGWEMPIQYSGIVEEHQAVRTAAGVFDVSHMGRFEVAGEQAAALLRRISTYDVNRLAPGEGH